MKKILFLAIFSVILFSIAPNLCAQNITNSSQEVKDLIEKKKNYNKSIGFGYKIQICNGKEEFVRNKLAEFVVLYPRVPVKLVYDDPDWKVQVGNYKSKLDADRAILIFRKEFSGIIVVPMGK